MSREQASNNLFACPCCGYATISEPKCYEVCEICAWEDDGQDDPHSHVNRGGPNENTLYEGRKSFLACGASSEASVKHTRRATNIDINLRSYKNKKV